MMDSSQQQTILDGLNPQQCEAVVHGEGPLLIIAGAGSGKTRTLVHRVAYKIAQGTPPSRILLLTFTRRAASEMLRRVDSLLQCLRSSTKKAVVTAHLLCDSEGDETATAPRQVDLATPSAPPVDTTHRPSPGSFSQSVWGGTFHATAARLLRVHGPTAGLDPDFTILDRSDSEDLLDVARTELGLSKSKKRFPRKGTCLAIYSHCVNSGPGRWTKC
jgi:DNA helicase II / ATP-dependent DNA helicase PcrA